MLSPDRHSADENQYGITASLKKTVQRKRPSHRPRSQFDSDSSGEDEDRGERDSLRVQRVRAKEAHDDAERSPLRPAALTERSHRGFRVFPELPASPQRVPKRLIKASPSEGIIGLCVPANVPPKVVTIQDYSFSSGAVSVFAGQTILFALARDVPVHVEHVLEGTCEENSGLCFVSPILQSPEHTTFAFTPLYVGQVHVSCQVYPEMECSVSIVSPESFRRVSSALSASAGPRILSTASYVFQGAGMGSLRRSVDSVSETLTQSSFFDSDDELSDQHSLHSTPHRKNFRPSLFSATALDAAEPFGTSAEPVLTGMDATAADIPLFARDLYERYSDYPGPTVDEKGIAFKISVEDFVFRPDAITVEQGSAVQFTYHGSVSVQKLCCDDEFDSVGLDGDQLAIFVHTFLTPGTFTVVNEVFSFMSCRITVTKSSHPMHDKTILSAPSGDDNNQNSLNILGYENRSSNHGEKSLSDFMDLKILRSSFLKNRKPSNGFIAVTSSISSGDDSSTDGDFNSSPIRSAISAQLARSKVEKIKPIDVTIAETPSSLEHSAAYLQNLVTQRMQSTLASPISSGSEIATDRSLPKLCGSFPLSSGSPLNSCSGDIGSISANDNIIGSHADKAVLLSTSSKRRHRRKTHSATVLNTSGNENLECLNNISKSILVSVPAEISLSGLQAAVKVVSIDFEKDIKESTQQDDGVSQVIEPVPDSAVSTIAVEDSNCIAPSVEKISALLCHAMTPQKPSKKTKRANLKPALTSAGPSVPNEEPPEKSLVLLVTNVESIGPRESDDVESIKPRESDDISRIYVGPERESWVFRSPPSSAIKLVQHPSSDGESAKPTKKLFDMLKAASETKRNKYRDKLMNPSGVRQLFSSPIKTAPCSGLDGWHHLTNIKTLIDIETFLLQRWDAVQEYLVSGVDNTNSRGVHRYEIDVCAKTNCSINNPIPITITSPVYNKQSGTRKKHKSSAQKSISKMYISKKT